MANRPALKIIKDILKDRIGLNPDSVGDSSISRAVDHRLERLKISDINQYALQLKTDEHELAELVDEVTVPETWFFRNTTPFEAFSKVLKKRLTSPVKKIRPLRILSIPCSTGEEPYSIAMTIINAGLATEKIEIDAVDINKKSLTKAKRAIYGRNSFRGADEDVKKTFFKKVGNGLQLDEKVKKMVDFRQGNILLDQLSPIPNYYDVVFCRNLLIYFDKDTQRMAHHRLNRVLRDDGLLFVGHAETSQIDTKYFDRYDYPHSFAFYKKSKHEMREQADNREIISAQTKIPEQWKDVFDNISRIPKKDFQSSEEWRRPLLTSDLQTKRTGKKQANSLRPAEKFIIRGKYDEAKAICYQYLEQYKDSAHAYYLLGLVTYSKKRNSHAESILRKAIYLDPNHHQALMLLTTLADERGDLEAVKSYQRRIKRVMMRKKTSLV